MKPFKKACLCLTLLFSLFVLRSAAEAGQWQEPQPLQDTRISTVYFKAGTALGVGYRSHLGRCGYDLSASYCVPLHLVSLKGSFLFYPFKDRFYMGLGGGIHHTVKRGNDTYPSIDLMLGYEVYRTEKLTWFVQLGLECMITGYQMFPIFPLPMLQVGVGF